MKSRTLAVQNKVYFNKDIIVLRLVCVTAGSYTSPGEVSIKDFLMVSSAFLGGTPAM